MLLEHGAVDYTFQRDAPNFATAGQCAETLATDAKTVMVLRRVAIARSMVGHNGYGRPIYRAGRQLLEAALANETEQVAVLLAQATMTKDNGVNYQRAMCDVYDGVPVVEHCDLAACALACVGMEWGQTPLHAAATNGNVQIAQMLLEHEARIDVRTHQLCGHGSVAAQYVNSQHHGRFGSCLDTEAMGNILTVGVGESIDAEARDLGLVRTSEDHGRQADPGTEMMGSLKAPQAECITDRSPDASAAAGGGKSDSPICPAAAPPSPTGVTPVVAESEPAPTTSAKPPTPAQEEPTTIHACAVPPPPVAKEPAPIDKAAPPPATNTPTKKHRSSSAQAAIKAKSAGNPTQQVQSPPPKFDRPNW